MESKRVETKNIWLHVTGNSLSYFGDLVYIMAINIWVSRITTDPSLLSLVTTISSLAMFIGNPIGGVVADLYDKRKILIFADMVCASATFITWLTYKPDHISLPFLILSQILLALTFSVYSPTTRSIAPLLAQGSSLKSLNAYLSVSSEVIKIISPAISGLLLSFSFISERELILINTTSFLLSACSNYCLKTNETKKHHSHKITNVLKSYFDVWKELGIVRLILVPVCIINFFSGGIVVLFPFIGKLVSKSHYPNMMLFQAIGAMIGGLIYGYLKREFAWSEARWLLVICSLSLLGLNPELPFYFHYIFLFIFGAALSIFNISFFTILQTLTPPKIIGRTFGLVYTISSGLVPIGNFTFGAISAENIKHGVTIAGIGMFFSLILFMYYGHELLNKQK